MLNFIIFLFASIGLTFIITQSYILKDFRKFVKKKNTKLGKLLSCSMCAGVYIGWFVQSLIMLKNGIWMTLEWGDLHYILYGFISSFVCYLVFLLMSPLIKKYD